MDIYKFGGSSVATAERMKKVISIIKNIDACVIVLSAVGKKDAADKKITDLLIDLCNSKNNFAKTKRIKKQIKSKFYEIAEKIDLKYNVEYFKQKLNFFLENINSYSDNYIISRGEYFTCSLFSLMTRIPFVDASDLIRFERDRRVSLKDTFNAIKRIKYKKYVTCGFYGSDSKGNIVLFPRGGGDISGAVLSRVYDSENFYNYTDVSGIYTIPPNYSKTNETVAQTNYSRLKTICSYGTQTFCYEAIKYIADKNITLYIKNTFAPFGKNTKVTDDFNFPGKPCVFIRKDVIELKIIISEKSELFGILFNFLKYIMSHKIILTDVSYSKNICSLYISEKDFMVIKNHPVIKNTRIQKNLTQIIKVKFLPKQPPKKNSCYMSAHCTEEEIKYKIKKLIGKNQ